MNFLVRSKKSERKKQDRNHVPPEKERGIPHKEERKKNK